MKLRRIITILTITAGLILSFAFTANAESKVVNGHCYFNGNDIVSDFTSKTIADSVKGLEPGDEVTFKVEFKNNYKVKTYWYMKNEVLKTLEQSFDRTENGGYTYRLTHITPEGERQDLFNNAAVGGDSRSGNMEGLHQATNATKKWFYIQDLKQGQKAYTELYVKFDGETEVNDYMDTYGKLKVAYAVELDKENGRTQKNLIKTGDNANLIIPFVTLTIALMLLILTVISYRYSRKERD